MSHSRFAAMTAALAILACVSTGLSQLPGTLPSPPTVTTLILQCAREEAERATPYIMEYEVLKYPGGDVTEGTGVCTDLVVRAFRKAGIDLQREVHEDITANRPAYPTIWDHKAPDRNIDHRRCPNLAVWFRRHATTLGTDIDARTLEEDWQPGDVVFFVHRGATHPWHVAIVSERKTPDGMPLVYDSFPPATSDSRRLDEYGSIHSHFRYDQTSATDHRTHQARPADMAQQQRETRSAR